MKHIYQIISCVQAAPSISLFTLQNTNPDRPLTYQPGQYVAINFLHQGRPTPARCFSVVSSPTEQDLIQIAMRVKGRYTTAVTQHAKPGDKITVSGPYGTFIYNSSRDINAIFLAGGIGIAPFMSMLRYNNRLNIKGNIILVYACRTQEDAAFAEEIMYYEKTNPNIQVLFVVEKGPMDRFEGSHSISGYVNEEVLYTIIGNSYLGNTYFMCGPPAFMNIMTRILKNRGVPNNKIFSEAFNQSKNDSSAKIFTLPTKVYTATAATLLAAPFVVLSNDIIMQHSYSSASKKNAYNGDVNTVDDPNTREEDIQEELNQELQEDTVFDYTREPDAIVPNDNTNNPNTPSSGSDTKTNTTPASPKAPSLTFAASALTVVKGGGVKLSWVASGTTPISCSASGAWSGIKNTSGSATVAPSSTTTYTLACSNTGGSVKKSLTITVTTKPVAASVQLSASKTAIIKGQSTTLSWSSGGTAPISCSASGGWSGTKNTSGTQSVAPTSTTTYSLTCSNSVGSSKKSVTVTVNIPATLSFSASRTTITEGDGVALSWSSSGTATVSCTASNAWSGGKSSNGSQTVYPASTRTYTLTCSNAYGSQSKSITITVNPASSGS